MNAKSVLKLKRNQEIQVKWFSDFFEEMKSSRNDSALEALLGELKVPKDQRAQMCVFFYYFVSRGLMSSERFVKDLSLTIECNDWYSSKEAEDVYYAIDLFQTLVEPTGLPFEIKSLHGYISIRFDGLVWNINFKEGLTVWRAGREDSREGLVVDIKSKEVPSISSLYQLLSSYINYVQGR